MALSKVSELMLVAYKEALATLPANHFAVTNLASTIFRLSGRDGRLAVQKAQREKTTSRPVLTNIQPTKAKGFKKLEFSKKNMEQVLEKPASTFGLKRVSKDGEVKPLNQLASEEHQGHTTSVEEKDLNVNAVVDEVTADDEANVNGFMAMVKDFGDDEKDEAFNQSFENLVNQAASEEHQVPPSQPLTQEELDLVTEMKPAAIGRTFPIERLRVTLNVLGIQYSETHTATVLGAALNKHLKAAKS